MLVSVPPSGANIDVDAGFSACAVGSQSSVTVLACLKGAEGTSFVTNQSHEGFAIVTPAPHDPPPLAPTSLFVQSCGDPPPV